MGRDLAEKYPIARETFEEADDALGLAISRICFEGPEEQLRLTENTQPAILTASVAAWRVLDEQGIKPALAAGPAWASTPHTLPLALLHLPTRFALCAIADAICRKLCR